MFRIKKAVRLARMILAQISIPICDQAANSGGSFLYFILIARLLGPEGMGWFGAIWMVISFALSLEMQWILLPLTSLRMESNSAEKLYGILLFRHGRMLLISVPIICIAIPLIFAETEGGYVTAGLALTAGWSLLTIEFIRFLFVRKGFPNLAVILSICKWLPAIIIISIAHYLGPLYPIHAIAYLILGYTMAIIAISFIMVNKCLDIRAVNRVDLARRLTLFARPLLVYGFTNSVCMLISTMIITKWLGVAVFGAYQAMRNLTNVFSFFIQLINIHYSAYLTRKIITNGPVMLSGALFSCGLLISGIGWILKEKATVVFLGNAYSNYSGILPIMIFLNFSNLANAIMAANARASGNTGVFYRIAFIALMGTLLQYPVARTGIGIQAVLLLIAGVSLVQFLVFFWEMGTAKGNISADFGLKDPT